MNIINQKCEIQYNNVIEGSINYAATRNYRLNLCRSVAVDQKHFAAFQQKF